MKMKGMLFLIGLGVGGTLLYQNVKNTGSGGSPHCFYGVCPWPATGGTL